LLPKGFEEGPADKKGLSRRFLVGKKRKRAHGKTPAWKGDYLMQTRRKKKLNRSR